MLKHITRNALITLAFFFLLLAGLELSLHLIGLIDNTRRPFAFKGPGGGKGGTVLCLGDSYTFGGNLAAEEAYPYQLRKLLPPDVDVINKGHCEYNSSQVLDELSGNLKKYSPKVVVLLAGSSDRWNSAGTEAGDKRFIYRREYDSALESTRRSFSSRLSDALLSLKVYRMYRLIALNLKFRKLQRETEKISRERLAARDGTARNQGMGVLAYLKNIYYDRLMQGTDGVNYERLAADYKAKKISDRDMAVYFEAMFYNSRYEKLFNLALDSLEYINSRPGSSPRNAAYLFVLAAAFDFQDLYSSGEVAEKLAALLARNPALRSDKTFLKYLEYFREKELAGGRVEKNLDRNLDQIAEAVAKSGARLIVMNYPATHVTANRALEAAAKRHNAVFVDVYPVFMKLIRAGGREKYLMGDDHATPLGHSEIAALLLPEVTRALK